MLARFACLLLFALLLARPVQAQELQPQGPYDKEVAGFLNYCQTQADLGPDYSCECLAAQFLNKRVELGPEPTSPEIINMLDVSLCPSAEIVEMADIPEEAIRDAEDFQNYCSGNATMKTTFDCECLAGEYLDARIEAGPDVARSSLILKIDHTCPNIEEAAGEAYSECYAQSTLVPTSGKPLDDFCECYARSYAKLRQEMKTAMHAQLRITLKSRAMTMCQ